MADLSRFSSTDIDGLANAAGLARWEMESSSFTDTLIDAMMAAWKAGTLGEGPLAQATPDRPTPAEASFFAFVSGVGGDVSEGAQKLGNAILGLGTGALEAAGAAKDLAKFLPMIALGLGVVVVLIVVKAKVG